MQNLTRAFQTTHCALLFIYGHGEIGCFFSIYGWMHEKMHVIYAPFNPFHMTQERRILLSGGGPRKVKHTWAQSSDSRRHMITWGLYWLFSTPASTTCVLVSQMHQTNYAKLWVRWSLKRKFLNGVCGTVEHGLGKKKSDIRTKKTENELNFKGQFASVHQSRKNSQDQILP